MAYQSGFPEGFVIKGFWLYRREFDFGADYCVRAAEDVFLCYDLEARGALKLFHCDLLP